MCVCCLSCMDRIHFFKAESAPDGALCRIKVHRLPADLQELYDVLGIMPYPSPACDISTLATRQDFTQPGVLVAVPRTVPMMRQVRVSVVVGGGWAHAPTSVVGIYVNCDPASGLHV